MPALPARTLAKLLQRQWDERALLALPDAPRRSLLRAARGRPGWIAICVALAAESRYWSDGRLRVSALGIDTEMLLRGLPALPPAGERR
jgi:hypothetical protein